MTETLDSAAPLGADRLITAAPNAATSVSAMGTVWPLTAPVVTTETNVSVPGPSTADVTLAALTNAARQTPAIITAAPSAAVEMADWTLAAVVEAAETTTAVPTERAAAETGVTQQLNLGVSHDHDHNKEQKLIQEQKNDDMSETHLEEDVVAADFPATDIIQRKSWPYESGVKARARGGERE